jgi:hypothetical protein
MDSNRENILASMHLTLTFDELLDCADLPDYVEIKI